jgi:hypothetical protein
MQTNPFFRLSAAVILIACLASCHKKNTQGRLIPNDAAFVMVIDGQSLSSKLPWDEIKQNPLLQKALADSATPATVKSVLNNPDSSGLETKSDIIFYVEKDSIGGYLAVEGSLKDSALFKNYCTQLLKGGAENEKDGVSYISRYPISIGWSKDKFVFISDLPSLGMTDNFQQRMISDSINVGANRDIGATLNSIFALEENNSLAKDDKFSKLVKETGDIFFWINPGKLYNKMLSSGPLAMLNLGDFYKGNITTATLSFDNGKITANTKSYMNEKVLAFYKQYVSGKISDEMLQRIPGKDVTGAIAANFNPAGIKEILKQLNLDGMANMALQKANLTTDDIVNAFKGDFVFAASDFNMKVDSVEENYGGSSFKMPKQTTEGNFIFAASIGDKDAFNKVFNTAKTLATQNSDGELPFSFDNNGTYFVLSNTKENTAKYLGASTNNFDFVSKINGQPFGGYFNIHSLLMAFQSIVEKDSASQAAYDASLKMWNNVYWKSGSLSGDVATGSIEINLVDNSTNSLKQLNQYVSKLSEIYKQKEDKISASEYREDMLQKDTAASEEELKKLDQEVKPDVPAN